MATLIKVKRVIVYYDQANPKNLNKNPAYSVLTYESDKAVDFPFLNGKHGIMVPKSFKQVGGDTYHESITLSTGDGTIMAGFGRSGLLLFRVRPNHRLKDITINPTDLDVTLHFDEESLIYSFYNLTGRYTGRITFKMVKDDNNIRKKLALDPENLSLRNSFINEVLIQPGTQYVPSYSPNRKYQIVHFKRFDELASIYKQTYAFDLLCKEYPELDPTKCESFLVQFRNENPLNKK
jgi:hypothetical protein